MRAVCGGGWRRDVQHTVPACRPAPTPLRLNCCPPPGHGQACRPPSGGDSVRHGASVALVRPFGAKTLSLRVLASLTPANAAPPPFQPPSTTKTRTRALQPGPALPRTTPMRALTPQPHFLLPHRPPPSLPPPRTCCTRRPSLVVGTHGWSSSFFGARRGPRPRSPPRPRPRSPSPRPRPKPREKPPRSAMLCVAAQHTQVNVLLDAFLAVPCQRGPPAWHTVFCSRPRSRLTRHATAHYT